VDLATLLEEGPVEEVAVVGDPDVRLELAAVLEEAIEEGPLVSLVEYVERTRVSVARRGIRGG
jgi:hypothetical protein